MRLTPAAGGGYTQVVVSATEFAPTALAVDASGNVFVVDTADNLIFFSVVAQQIGNKLRGREQ